MKQRIIKGVMIGTMCSILILPSVVLAGQGRGTGKSPASHGQSRSMEQVREQRRLEHRNQVVEPGTKSVNGARKGHSYGPGDGTGYDGIGPKDGTGYGAPSQI
jgi:hypothetical protein